MITTLPILFSGPMIRAIPDFKDMTRRVMQPQPAPGSTLESYGTHATFSDGTKVKCPYGPGIHAEGHYMWVRETWGVHKAWDETKPSEINHLVSVYYFADNFVREITASPMSFYGEQDLTTIKKRPSIFMPRWASRTLLQHTAPIGIARVQSITAHDALREGIQTGMPPQGFGPRAIFRPNPKDYATFSIFTDTFAQLWDAINFRRGLGWLVNPWVWEISFTESHDVG